MVWHMQIKRLKAQHEQLLESQRRAALVAQEQVRLLGWTPLFSAHERPCRKELDTSYTKYAG
jgi:hypothetical protein